MRKPEGIFTPHLDLDEHLLWMNRDDHKSYPTYVRRLSLLFFTMLCLGGLSVAMWSNHPMVYVLYAIIICFSISEFRHSIFFPNNIWYGISNTRALIKRDNSLKILYFRDVFTISVYEKQRGLYTIVFKGKIERLIVSNLLLHQIREIIPLLQEHTSAEIDIPNIPNQPTIS